MKRSHLILLLTINACFLYANDTIKVGDLYYKLYNSDKTATVIHVYKTEKDTALYHDLTSITIPSVVRHKGKCYKVRGIASYTFYGCKKLKSVILPKTMGSIHPGVFQNCESLNSINFSSTHISNSYAGYAFLGCVNLPTPQFNKHVFAFLPVSYSGSYSIPNGIERIWDCAFGDCVNLTTVNIPSSVSDFHSTAFRGCVNLTTINVDPSNSYFCSVDGVVYNKDTTELVVFPWGRRGEYSIPESVNTWNIRGAVNITELTVPSKIKWVYHPIEGESLTAINVSPNNQSLCSVDGVLFDKYERKLIQFPPRKQQQNYVIPESVDEIGEAAFLGCTNLRCITISNRFTKIRPEAFKGCINLKEVHYPQGLDLSRAGIPSTVKLIAYNPTNSSTNIATASSRSTSDTNSATTSRTASSSTTSQSTTHTQNTYTKPTTPTSRPICTILSPKEGDPYSTPTIRLEYKIENISEVESVKFFVNGIERKPKNNGSNKGVRLEYGTVVELEMPTENGKDASISIVVVDANNDERIVGRRKLKYVSVHKPTLHVFAVGVNKYKAEGFTKLDYAEQDAKDFTNVIMEMADKNMYKKVDTTLILGSAATTFNLQERLTQLSNQVEPNDVVMIFFSGHGLKENKKSYFISSDAIRPYQGLDMEFIHNRADEMECPVFVFMDACHSGPSYDKTKGVIEPIIVAEKGVIGFYSCKSGQQSIEKKEYKNGVFTYVLVRGLKGAADVDEDGYISISDLENYVKKQVPSLSERKQTPVVLNSEVGDAILFRIKKK